MRLWGVIGVVSAASHLGASTYRSARAYSGSVIEVAVARTQKQNNEIDARHLDEISYRCMHANKRSLFEQVLTDLRDA